MDKLVAECNFMLIVNESANHRLRIRILWILKLKCHRIFKIKFDKSYNMKLEKFLDLQTYKQN